MNIEEHNKKHPAPPKLERIWLVEGATGEYSDHTEWPVCFYYDEAKAKEHVEKAAARYRDIAAILKADEDAEDCSGTCIRGPSAECPKHKDLKNEWDPTMQVDYTGTNYRCYPVELGQLAAKP